MPTRISREAFLSKEGAYKPSFLKVRGFQNLKVSVLPLAGGKVSRPPNLLDPPFTSMVML